MGTRPAKSSDRPEPASRVYRCRVAIHGRSNREKAALDGTAPSIGSVGDASDNALMETINGIHKAENIRTTVFYDGAYKSIGIVEYATACWIEWQRTTVGYTQASATPHQPSTGTPNTQPSAESRNRI